MQTVNIHEAKTHFSRLIEAAERGEAIVIARAGHPVAVLSAYRPARRPLAPPGSMQGRDWQLGEDFDAPLDTLFDSLHTDDLQPTGTAR